MTDNDVERTDNDVKSTDNHVERTDNHVERTDNDIGRTDKMLKELIMTLEGLIKCWKNLLRYDQKRQKRIGTTGTNKHAICKHNLPGEKRWDGHIPLTIGFRIQLQPTTAS